ncbi:hypothetical protein KSP39_PZI012894 [Platanthera zijinensis]|uniref:KIB1-4 beta-propeller domain-containing protein n=1 Tax=Platanthera zijinensis TaxID=2320716 RepID=A0AAP0BBB3_9ASPA
MHRREVGGSRHCHILARLRRLACTLGKRFVGRPLPSSLPSGPLSVSRTSPWLLLPTSAAQGFNVLRFFSLIENRFYTIQNLSPLTKQKMFETSFQGWILIVDVTAFIPIFLNPFTRHELPLPSLLTIPMEDSISDLPRADLAELILQEFLRKIIFIPSSQPDAIAVVLWMDTFFRYCLPHLRVGDVAKEVRTDGRRISQKTNLVYLIHYIDIYLYKYTK